MEGLKNSHIDKVVSQTIDKDSVVSYLEKLSKNQFEKEIEKTPKDKKIIDFTQRCLDEYISQFKKGDIYEVPEEKIHLVSIGGVLDFTNKKIAEGVAASRHGSCIVDRNSDDIIFSLRLFHEMYHLKDFTSIDVKSEEPFLASRRSGITIYGKNGNNYFSQTNEIINDYFCKKFLEEKIKYSDIFDKEDKKNHVFTSPRTKKIDLFEEKCEEIYQKNKNDFSSKEEIRRLFIEADINGNLLPIARLIEKTYGEGSFRRLGERK